MSSTNLSHKMGGEDRAKGLDLKFFHKQVGNKGTDGGTHGIIMDLFIILTLGEEVHVFEAELQ